MKRQGRLIEKIAEFENLHLAYYKAQREKSAKREVLEYGKRLQANLDNLRGQVLSGKAEIGDYHYFTIYDPKERQICAAPFGQRVLHHALMNVCHPFFEKVQIFDSYASRPGKGTYAALDRARYFHKHHRWFLKLDFRKYFDSLDHAILQQQLRRLFKDSRLLNIFAAIIDSYHVNQNRGVPIGNLTSQYFANHYLAKLDHYVKEVLRIRAYVRYMDDLILWHKDKGTLIKAASGIRQHAESELKLTLKPFCLNRNSHGLPFLGYLLYPDRVRLARRSRTRFIKKLVTYEKAVRSNRWTQEEYQSHVLPLVAFTEYAQAREFRKKAIRNVGI